MDTATTFCEVCTMRDNRYIDPCGVSCCRKAAYGTCPAVAWSRSLQMDTMRAEYVDPQLSSKARGDIIISVDHPGIAAYCLRDDYREGRSHE